MASTQVNQWPASISGRDEILSDQMVDIAAYAERDKALRLAEHAQGQAADTVVQAIGIALLRPAVDQLQHNGEDEKRDRVNDKIHNNRTTVIAARWR